jgi:hypothetical protein
VFHGQVLGEAIDRIVLVDLEECTQIQASKDSLTLTERSSSQPVKGEKQHVQTLRKSLTLQVPELTERKGNANSGYGSDESPKYD